MEGWIDELAEALGEEALTREEANDLLGAARDVAHRVERKITPSPRSCSVRPSDGRRAEAPRARTPCDARSRRPRACCLTAGRMTFGGRG